MKFINYLESIAGVSIFPLISLMIFFVFFVTLIVYATKILSKERVNAMKNVPLSEMDNELEIPVNHAK